MQRRQIFIIINKTGSATPRFFLCILPLLLSTVCLWRSAEAQTREEETSTGVESSLDSHSASPAPSSAAASLDQSALRSSIIERTNEFRKSHDLEPLNSAAALRSAAEKFSKFLAKQQLIGHYADGRSPRERARSAGYSVCLTAENLAFHSLLPAERLAVEIVEGWKQSAPHRKNLLLTGLLETGIGISVEDDVVYVVQLLARPMSEAVEVRLTNRSPETIRYEIGDSSQPLPSGHSHRQSRCLAYPLTIQLGRKKETLKISDNAHYVIQEQGTELTVHQAR